MKTSKYIGYREHDLLWHFRTVASPRRALWASTTGPAALAPGLPWAPVAMNNCSCCGSCSCSCCNYSWVSRVRYFAQCVYSPFIPIIIAANPIRPPKLSGIVLSPTVLDNAVSIAAWLHEIYPPGGVSHLFTTVWPEKWSLPFDVGSCSFQPYPVISILWQISIDF